MGHGKTNSRIYHIWENMIQRCTNPKAAKYHLYGGRGISVCEAWKKFDQFYKDLGEPGTKDTLDRVDPDGDYTLNNCRWASYSAQNRNRRPYSASGFKGVYKITDTCYSSQITVNRKKIHLGSFRTAKEAHMAYLNARIERGLV